MNKTVGRSHTTEPKNKEFLRACCHYLTHFFCLAVIAETTTYTVSQGSSTFNCWSEQEGGDIIINPTQLFLLTELFYYFSYDFLNIKKI